MSLQDEIWQMRACHIMVNLIFIWFKCKILKAQLNSLDHRFIRTKSNKSVKDRSYILKSFSTDFLKRKRLTGFYIRNKTKTTENKDYCGWILPRAIYLTHSYVQLSIFSPESYLRYLWYMIDMLLIELLCCMVPHANFDRHPIAFVHLLY